MDSAKIAFIGAGNIGGSLISGLIADGYDANLILAANPHAGKLEKLAKLFNINTTQDNLEAAQSADILVFAVKPKDIKKVSQQLADIVAEKKSLVISVAAGIRVENINRWLGGQATIVRAMPNTPALIRAGATALFANQQVNGEQKELAESIMRAVGLTLWVENEALMNVVTALSASGPAYFFLIMEALQKAAESLGLQQDTAKLLTLQTALGAARMAMESDREIDELRQIVTSPGGTTECAIEVLEQGEIRGLLAKALNAASSRADELADMLAD